MTYTKTDRLIEAITDMITSGALQPGDKLPSGAELAERYDVSRMTVRMATERLRAAGLIVTVPGSGVYVAERQAP